MGMANLLRRAVVVRATLCATLFLFVFGAAGRTGESQPDEAQADVRSRWEAANRPDEEVVTQVSLSDIPILHTILPETQNATIHPTVEVDGYYYRFLVESPHGAYEVTSVRKLLKRLHEIDVIEHFRTTEEGNAILEALGESIVNVGKGLGNAVRHPGVTVKRIGSGTGRFLRATGGFFSKPFRRGNPELASGGTDLALLGKGPAGTERRRVAFELGLDVYTQNENVKAILNEIGRKRLLGKLPVGTAVFALPGGAVFTLSLTPMGYDASTERLIRDNDPAELVRTLGLQFEETFGLEYPERESALYRLLHNPNYTPREKAYLLRYFLDLRDLTGMEGALAFLAQVQTHEQASVVCTQVELLSLLHQRGKPLVRFVPVHNTLGGLARDGTLCLVISIDTVRFQGDVPRSLQRSINAAKQVGAQRIAILSTGDIDKASIDLANRMGVLVYDNILRHKVFQRPRHEGDPTLWSALASGKRTAADTTAVQSFPSATGTALEPGPEVPPAPPAPPPASTGSAPARGTAPASALPELMQ